MLMSEAVEQEHRGVLLLPQAKCGVMSLRGRGPAVHPHHTVLFPEPLDSRRERASTTSQADELYQCSLGRLPLTHTCLSSLVLDVYIFIGSDAYVRFCTIIISG